MSSFLEGFRATGGVRLHRPLALIVAEPISLLPKPAKPWKNLRSSVSISLAIHAVLLFVLSWIYFDFRNICCLEPFLTLVISDNNSRFDDVELDISAPADATTADEEQAEPSDEPALFQEDTMTLAAVSANPETVREPDRNRIERPIIPVLKSAPKKPTVTSKSASSKRGSSSDADGENIDHFVGRSPNSKAMLLKRMGGTDASEAAVGRGLVWLKNHQLVDGSWNFQHLLNPRCDCTMPGRLDNNPNAATAMALLAFLGAGHTHESGEYQTEVQQGLDFLLSHGVSADRGICFYGNLVGQQTFYTHGLVTIALSEAFAMTHDPKLRPAIVGAVEFLVATQHEGGGWRYAPGQAGDTSVVAWQLMALKSAQFSRISVPQSVLLRTETFMSSVAGTRGSQYAYLPGRPPTPSMTAAGLLCRMYLGWKETNGALRSGTRYLADQGPDLDDMYYNYYATQVLHHWGGEEWERWNVVMRDHLVKMQIRDGHATGSWDVTDRHGNMGGRLYMTTLALLTLEVYYRHLPLYQKDRIELPLIQQPAAAKKP